MRRTFVFKLSIMSKCYRSAVLAQWAVAPFLPTMQHSNSVTSPGATYQITCSGLIIWRIGLRWGQVRVQDAFSLSHICLQSCTVLLHPMHLEILIQRHPLNFFIKRYSLHNAEKTASTSSGKSNQIPALGIKAQQHSPLTNVRGCPHEKKKKDKTENPNTQIPESQIKLRPGWWQLKKQRESVWAACSLKAIHLQPQQAGRQLTAN